MYHFLGSDPAHVTDSDLMRFSFEGQTQKHSVLDLSNNVLDFLLYINTNGKEEFNFEGELEVRFKYYFINKAKPEDAVIEKPNNVMKFKILAKAINPFELSFDYQLLNPLVKHLNYDSSSMKKLFVVNEKCWINLTIDNLHNPILIQSIKFETTASEEDIKIIKPIQMTDVLLHEREQLKAGMLMQPLEEKLDYVIGFVNIRWLRKDLQNQQPGRIEVLNEEIIPLDRFRFEKLRVKVTIQAPEAVVLNEFFEIDFLITSQHSELMDLRTIVEAADNFMVCGESECRVRIAPGETQLIKMKTVGLKAGFYQLPGIKLTDLKTKDRTEVLKSVYNKFVRVLQEKISEY